MMFSKMASFLAFLFVASAAAQQDAAQGKPSLRHAPRRLQEIETMAPTSAPTPAPQASVDGDRDVDMEGITMAPTPVMTGSPTDMTDTESTSGAASWRSSSVASAAVLFGSVAAAAVMA